MTPALPTSAPPSGSCSPFPGDQFEGPEKKLWVTFSPDCNLSGETRNLRSLSRAQIETVTDAAKCTILSYVFNDVVDAYLLSESSLFVSDYSMTIKTCGTTTLLCALDVILQLGISLGLSPEIVSFTRVAYLFPQQQLHPHTSFNVEISYLDAILRSYGRVFRNATNVSDNWFCFLASFSSNHHSIESHLQTPTTRTLEIAMYDLDPREMRQFMFHSQPSRVGSDDPHSGTTSSAGIYPLLSKANCVDAYNFDPCGYSLNAIASCGGYYTIHITPEDGASYLSFETTVETEDAASLVATVVQKFRPSRFTISVISTTPISDADLAPIKSSSYINHGKLNKLLFGSFSPTSSPNLQNLMMSTCDIAFSVSTYRSNDEPYLMIGPNLMVPMPVTGWRRDVSSLKDSAVDVLERVSKSYGAMCLPIGLDLTECDLSTVIPPTDPEFVEPPTLIIDLARVCRNYLQLLETTEDRCVEFRYITRCCADLALLELLAGFEDIVFEISDTEELALLDRLEVPTERIVLRVAVPSTSTLRLLDRVSGIILHDVPDADMAAAIQQSKVFVEYVSSADSMNEVNYKLELIQNMTKSAVRAVGCEGSCKELCLSNSGGRYISLQNKNALPMGVVLSRALAVTKGHPVVVELSSSLIWGAMSVVLSVIGQRIRVNMNYKHSHKLNDHNCHQFCHLNDGVYGIFGRSWLQDSNCSVNRQLEPRLIDRHWTATQNVENDVLLQTTVWGPTCDSSDRIWDGCMAEVHVGERLVFDNVGAFCSSSVTKFNGFSDHFKYVYVTSAHT